MTDKPDADHAALERLEQLAPGTPLLLKTADYDAELIAVEADRIAAAEHHRATRTTAREARTPSPPTWAGKDPGDLTLDELAELRTVVQQRLSRYETKARTMSGALANLDRRIAGRFGLAVADDGDPGEWPTELIRDEFGWPGSPGA